MNKHPSSLTNPATENFTANAKAAALLRQISLESLGVKADISQKVMGAYRLGNQEITNEHKDAICNVLGLSADVLTEVYPEEECQDRLRAAFSAAGVVLSEIETTNVTVDADIAQDFSREGIQETLPQDVGDDESIVAQQSTESAAVRWRGDVAWIEGKSFDLSDKAVRRTVCQHIRVAKGKLTIKALIEAATPNRNKSTWLGSVENGLSRMTPEELQSIAREVNTPVAVLFTGQGLDLTKLRKEKKVRWPKMLLFYHRLRTKHGLSSSEVACSTGVLSWLKASLQANCWNWLVNLMTMSIGMRFGSTKPNLDSR